MNKDTFLQIEEKNRQIIKVSMNYVDMAEDLIAGLLLSQIVYWFLPSKNGKSKLRIHRNGKDWLAKRREDWWKEIRITPKQYDRAISILVNKNFVKCSTFKFNGNPTVHITINWKVFLTKYEEIARVSFDDKIGYNQASGSRDLANNTTNDENLANNTTNSKNRGEYRCLPKVNIEVDQRSISKLTKGEVPYIEDTENTTENTNIDSSSKEEGESSIPKTISNTTNNNQNQQPEDTSSSSSDSPSLSSPKEYGNIEVNYLIQKLKEHAGVQSLDGTIKKNRFAAFSAIKKLKKELIANNYEPSYQAVTAHIDAMLANIKENDAFNSRNLTSAMYFDRYFPRLWVSAREEPEGIWHLSDE